jgi:transposase InsO family protein
LSRGAQNSAHNNNATRMSSNAGNPHDNAMVESFFATLKKEELYD